MFFRAFEKIFIDIKQVISFIVCILIALSGLLFVYWLIYAAKIPLPNWFDSFIWGLIDLITCAFKNKEFYANIIDIVPVFASIILIVIIYFMNLLNFFVDKCHKKYKTTLLNYRKKLENTINTELRNDFIKQLKNTNYLALKFKLIAKSVHSYLSELEVNQDDLDSTVYKLQNEILSSLTHSSIESKGIIDGVCYLSINDLTCTKLVFSELVENTTKLINSVVNKNVSMDFLCVASTYDRVEEKILCFNELDKLLSLHIVNKIVVPERFKVVFDNLYSSYFEFKVLGEYNLNPINDRIRNVMLYSINRKK